MTCTIDACERIATDTAYSRSQTCIMTDLMAAILASITTRLTYGLANTFY